MWFYLGHNPSPPALLSLSYSPASSLDCFPCFGMEVFLKSGQLLLEQQWDGHDKTFPGVGGGFEERLKGVIDEQSVSLISSAKDRGESFGDGFQEYWKISQMKLVIILKAVSTCKNKPSKCSMRGELWFICLKGDNEFFCCPSLTCHNPRVSHHRVHHCVSHQIFWADNCQSSSQSIRQLTLWIDKECFMSSFS